MSQFAINKNGVTNDVGAELFAAFVKGLLPTNGIINAFDNLACAKVNDNLVRLSPGLYNMSGFVTGVKPGTTADLAVDSGTGGYNRIDLVIAEFVKNGGGAGIDTSQIRILKGTSTTGTPVDPTLTQEDINGTGVTRQEALYRLTITGTTLAAPELMASVLDNLASVVAMLALKAPLSSPALTGTPTVPTAAAGTNTTQAASTAFVRAQIPIDAPFDLLAEYKVTGSAVTSIDFSKLDINAHKSYRIEFELINPVSNYVKYFIYINGDTTNTNYWAQNAVGSGGYMYPARTNEPAFGFVNANGRIFGDILVSLCGGIPYLVVKSARFTQTALEVGMDAIAKTVGVANITNLTFTASVANSIAVGSKIRIYRGDV